MVRTEIINTLLRHFDKPWYLEIGTADGWNFDTVKAHFKIGVDPGENVRCAGFNGTSDAYFNDIHLAQFTYDVVFVDGLHEAKQAWRDVWHASKRLKPGGFIVMHDCLPPTWMHAGPEPYGGPGSAWNGDVYKAAVQATKYFDAVTVDTDWGCTVLQPYPKGVMSNGDIFFCPQELEVDMDWHEFNDKREELLNIITPEEFVERYEREKVA